MRKIAFLFLLPLLVQALAAQDRPNDRSASSTWSDLTLQVSTSPEIKFGLTNHLYLPFLQGTSPLTQDNSIDLALGADITPISLNGIFEAVWTPAAVFQFSAGGRIGSGWNFTLFGNELYGIGLNIPDVVGMSINEGGAFDGLLWKLQTGGAVQFDLAAIYPGDWNHLVARSYHEVNYRGYTRAKAGESWFYENDGGENINGFNYYGNILLGYQMPMIFNMAAFLAETDLYLYNTPGRSKWGDDIVRWTLSGIFGFTVTRQLDVTLVTQLRTQRNYMESNWRDLYYRNRTIRGSAPAHLEFYRIAAVLTYKL